MSERPSRCPDVHVREASVSRLRNTSRSTLFSMSPAPAIIGSGPLQSDFDHAFLSVVGHKWAMLHSISSEWSSDVGETLINAMRLWGVGAAFLRGVTPIIGFATWPTNRAS